MLPSLNFEESFNFLNSAICVLKAIRTIHIWTLVLIQSNILLPCLSIYQGFLFSPKYQVHVLSNVDCYCIYRAPLYTVLFCPPQRGTVNGGLTVQRYQFEPLYKTLLLISVMVPSPVLLRYCADLRGSVLCSQDAEHEIRHHAGSSSEQVRKGDRCSLLHSRFLRRGASSGTFLAIC